jgi:mannosyl-3-phosphoglycerate phosphatase family protein
VRKVVFSDLNGILLDPDSYSCGPAEPGIRTLGELGHPLVLCSSKTRAEIEYWRQRLDNSEPFIVENGGAIYIPRNYFPFRPEGSKLRDGYEVIELGTPYRELVETLRRASAVAECPTIGFHQMSVAEICICTMLPVRQAELAKRREYDEPFEIAGSGVRRLLSTIRLFGKNWTQDERFYHITGGHDKASAVRLLSALFARAFGEPVQERVVTTFNGWQDAIHDLVAEPAAVY